MIALFSRSRSAARRRVTLSVALLEDRNLLAVILPSVNLSAAQVAALGQSLANAASQVDPTNALGDLENLQTAISNNISALLANPVPNAALERALLQIDVDSLAIVTAAVDDLGGGGTILT